MQQQKATRKRKTSQEENKQFKCRVQGCDKAYARYPSLYTHIKLKHPNHPLQALIPSKQQNGDQKVRPGSKPIDIKQDTVNLLCNANFLLFFKEIKDLPVFDSNLKDYFLGEQCGYTKLNQKLLQKGNKKLLDNFILIISEAQNDTKLENSIMSVSGFLKDSNQNFKSNLQSYSSIQQNTPKNFYGFFVICRELIKPLTDEFALELCYFFNKIIDLAKNMGGVSVQDFIEIIRKEMNKLITNNIDDFQKLAALSEKQRKEFNYKFAKNLSQLFKIY